MTTEQTFSELLDAIECDDSALRLELMELLFKKIQEGEPALSLIHI